MDALAGFLASQPYVLLFGVVGAAYALGQVKVKGYGLGVTASAIIIGTVVSALASRHGVKLAIDEFTKLLFYYLFMHAVGLRVGPAFVQGLKGDGLKYALLAVICCASGLALSVGLAHWFELPPGSAAGILAGAMTMSAALGAAEQAVSSGAYVVPEGMSAAQVSGNIALAYGVTYVWGTVGIVLLVRYLPAIFRMDARAAAREYEAAMGESALGGPEGGAHEAFGARAYRLDNPATAGRTVGAVRSEVPLYRWLGVERDGEVLAAADSLELRAGDIVALYGSTAALTDHMGLIGPEVADSRALHVALDRADILVTSREFVNSDMDSLRREFGGAVQLLSMEREGRPVPARASGSLRRGDVLHVVGLVDAVRRLAARAGVVSRPSISTDLLVLSVGMIAGFLIGALEVVVNGMPIGLGAAGGLLVSGVIVASLRVRFPVVAATPDSSRQLLEDLGLTVFVAIVGINVGATLLDNLSGSTAIDLLVAGFVVTVLPPVLVWVVGAYLMKLNTAILMGATAGARSHSAPCAEAAAEIGSAVPWVSFSVGYAISGVLLTVFGYVAMIL